MSQTSGIITWWPHPWDGYRDINSDDSTEFVFGIELGDIDNDSLINDNIQEIIKKKKKNLYTNPLLELILFNSPYFVYEYVNCH